MPPHRSFLLATIVLLVAVVHAQPNVTASNIPVTIVTNSTDDVSFCEQCRDKGICTWAYQGSPGVYCGSWLDGSSQRRACCCPVATLCAATTSDYKCNCLDAMSPEGKSKKNKYKVWERILVAVAVLCVVLGAVYFFIKRSRSGREDEKDEQEMGQTIYTKHSAPRPCTGSSSGLVLAPLAATSYPQSVCTTEPALVSPPPQ